METATANRSVKGKGKGKGKGTKAEAKAETKAVTAAPAPEAVTRRATVEDSDSGPIEVALPCAEAKELRGESKRGKLLELLNKGKGVTMGEMQSKFAWKPRDCADALRLLAKVNGVKTRRDETGRWHVAGKTVTK